MEAKWCWDELQALKYNLHKVLELRDAGLLLARKSFDQKQLVTASEAE